MPNQQRWRLLPAGPASGPSNMATDEALLTGLVEDPSAGHTLRFYWFEPPALSIGAYQPLEEVDLFACETAGIDVVRRPTGGRAVLHDGCITYSLCGPADGPVFSGSVRQSYGRIAEALVQAVQSLGAIGVTPAPPDVRTRAGPACFDSAAPYELLAGGSKLAGHAQVRRGGAALQHGSLRLTADRVSITGLLRHRAGRVAAVTHGEPPVLSHLARRAVSRPEAETALREAFAQAFCVRLVEGVLRGDERYQAARLERERYRDAAWTGRR